MSERLYDLLARLPLITAQINALQDRADRAEAALAVALSRHCSHCHETVERARQMTGRPEQFELPLGDACDGDAE